ncbi:MAG: RNA polymerase sigma factor [Pseudomonadota bacterium]|jgi:RNA polymerase sigma-70 factor (ECF subfamily)|nr:RNA polymerase subunit sigma-24 [Gammaproteobacteria bacterium]MCH2344490.1 RNA polymerase sigma factor [Pseudomonadales bacterium]MEC9223309.1 RNA polymerase sigma factor [Pseudomonadota bacterium]MEE2608088.1 RNA polymerase sigma factor [Pseudomonadota bacterium]MEE3172421.1 RNA polymerase sigma factor [Pseudomonadota bacterium]|tara:strand:- start:114 stop:692 length:579 start_codon:yes stop_codon:yes gene_type:complete
MSLVNEDEALIAAALNGSAYAWEKLVKRYETQIFNYSVRLTGNSSDAMDLMQEVFLGVYRNLHRFRGDAKFSSWIFRIAHNKAVDMNRRRRLLSNQLRINDDEFDILDILPGDTGNEPDEKLGTQQQNGKITRMLARLSLEQRLVVEFKVFQSLTFDEIAVMQDISANTVKTRFYTALKKLKAVSEENNVLS